MNNPEPTILERVHGSVSKDKDGKTSMQIADELNLKDIQVKNACHTLVFRGMINRTGRGPSSKFKPKDKGIPVKIIENPANKDAKPEIPPILPIKIARYKFLERKIVTIERIIDRLTGDDKDIMISILNDYKNLTR